MYGNQRGQIIGLKQREREAAEGRRALELWIRRVAQTLRENLPADPDGQDHRLIEWAADALNRVLKGQIPDAFEPDGDAGSDPSH